MDNDNRWMVAVLLGQAEEALRRAQEERNGLRVAKVRTWLAALEDEAARLLRKAQCQG